MQPFGPHLVERALDQPGADALAAELGRHLGVLEGDDTARSLVIGGGEVAIDLKFETMFFAVVVNRVAHVVSSVISFRSVRKDSSRSLLQGAKWFPRLEQDIRPSKRSDRSPDLRSVVLAGR